MFSSCGPGYMTSSLSLHVIPKQKDDIMCRVKLKKT